MVDDPENLTLVFLRRLDAKLDALILDVRELKDRVSAVELGLTAVRRDIAALAERTPGCRGRWTGCART